MARTMKTFLIVVIVGCISLGGIDAMGKRAVNSNSKNKEVNNEVNNENFKPVTEPKEFTVEVSDSINGADQMRHEKWDNGTITGSYVAPHRNGKFLKTEYIADKDGFRILKTEELTREQMMKSQQAGTDTAKITIQNDHQDPISYIVTKEQLEKGQQKEKAKSKSQTQSQ